MRAKHAIVAAVVLSVVIVLAFSATAMAYNITPPPPGTAGDTAPHDGYNTGVNGTDFCIQCHDVHEATGDYVLTRKATVTATCGTCHGIFGATANPAQVPNWSPNVPATMAGTPPTTSDLVAYNEDMSAMTGGNTGTMNAVPGHSLGVMYGGTVVRNDNSIPGSTQTLKVITSPPPLNIFNGEADTSFYGTQGLYCASCHSPHGAATTNGGVDGRNGVGRVITDGARGEAAILSSRPNHISTDVSGYADGGFCLACHDKRNGPDSSQTTTETGPDGSTHVVGRDNAGNPLHNHPSSVCLSCHGDETVGGTQDFPHTSSHQRILTQEPDALCLGCHQAGFLP